MKLKVEDMLVNTTDGGELDGSIMVIIELTANAVGFMYPKAPLKPMFWYPKLTILDRLLRGQLKIVTNDKVEGFVE